MFLSDKLTIDERRRTRDGYMVVSARVAQFDNIQLYAGSEVGKPEKAVVRVYRPRDEVTSDATLHSFAHRPVTVGHPSQQVTADTWGSVAKGWTGDAVKEEGKFIRVDMLLADAEAIKAVEDGTRELSMGYDCSLEWTSGTTPTGEAYDAIQRGIRSNHVAIVAAARGGPELRIGDGAQKDLNTLTDADQIAMRDTVKGMPLKDAAALPIFDNVRGLMVSNMRAEEYYAIVAGAMVPERDPLTGDAARAEAARDQMIANMESAWKR